LPGIFPDADNGSHSSQQAANSNARVKALRKKYHGMLRVTEHFAKSLKVIRNDTVEWGIYKFLAFHCNYIYRTVSEISSSNNGMTLKSGLGSLRSLKMAPFDRLHMTSYYQSVTIIAVALCLVLFPR